MNWLGRNLIAPALVVGAVYGCFEAYRYQSERSAGLQRQLDERGGVEVMEGKFVGYQYQTNVRYYGTGQAEDGTMYEFVGLECDRPYSKGDRINLRTDWWGIVRVGGLSGHVQVRP